MCFMFTLLLPFFFPFSLLSCPLLSSLLFSFFSSPLSSFSSPPLSSHLSFALSFSFLSSPLLSFFSLPSPPLPSPLLSFLSQLDLSPLEVAILGMQDKITALRKCLSQTPTDTKLLQMLLQGGIATAVNQGPFAIAKCFLDVPIHAYSHDHRRLRVCFKEFTRR